MLADFHKYLAEYDNNDHKADSYRHKYLAKPYLFFFACVMMISSTEHIVNFPCPAPLRVIGKDGAINREWQ